MNIPPSFLKAYLTRQEITSIWSESSGTGPSGSSTAKCGSGRGKSIPVEIIIGPMSWTHDSNDGAHYYLSEYQLGYEHGC